MTKEIHLLTTDIPTEVLNLLADNQIIFAAVASTVNERYKRLINFSVPISIQPYSYLTAKPREISRIYLFTAPFTTGVSLEICIEGCQGEETKNSIRRKAFFSILCLIRKARKTLGKFLLFNVSFLCISYFLSFARPGFQWLQ